MAVDSWTSENMDWSIIAGGLPYNYMEALRQALYERLEILEMEDLLISSAVDLTQPLVKEDMYSSLWYSTFVDALEGVIPYYLNNKYNGGDYEGVGSIPFWSKTSILDYLGYDDWVITRTLSENISYVYRWRPFRKTWFQQMYEVLNLLIWTKGEPTQVSSDIREGRATFSSYPAGQQDAEDDWGNASWTPHDPFEIRQDFYYWDNETYVVERIRSTFKFDKMENAVFGSYAAIPSDKNHIYNFYCRFLHSWFWHENIIDDYIYENNDYPAFTEGLFGVYDSTLTPTNTTEHEYTLGDFDSLSGTWGPYQSHKGYEIKQVEADQLVMVLKWNVDGGFDFVV